MRSSTSSHTRGLLFALCTVFVIGSEYSPAPLAADEVPQLPEFIKKEFEKENPTGQELFDEIVKFPTGHDDPLKYIRLRDQLLAKPDELAAIIQKNEGAPDWKVRTLIRILKDRQGAGEKYAVFQRHLTKHFKDLDTAEGNGPEPIILVLNYEKIRALSKPLEGLQSDAQWFLTERVMWPLGAEDQLSAIALALLKTPESGETLSAVVNDKNDWTMSFALVYALRFLKEPKSIPALLDVAWSNPSFGIRKAAVEAIGYFGDKAVIGELEKIGVADRDPMVKDAVKSAIANIKANLAAKN